MPARSKAEVEAAVQRAQSAAQLRMDEAQKRADERSKKKLKAEVEKAGGKASKAAAPPREAAKAAAKPAPPAKAPAGAAQDVTGAGFGPEPANSWSDAAATRFCRPILWPRCAIAAGAEQHRGRGRRAPRSCGSTRRRTRQTSATRNSRPRSRRPEARHPRPPHRRARQPHRRERQPHRRERQPHRRAKHASWSRSTARRSHWCSWPRPGDHTVAVTGALHRDWW
jgi:hypothetical protein